MTNGQPLTRVILKVEAAKLDGKGPGWASKDDAMPLYEYRCEQCGRLTERIQKFSDPELTVCPHCGGRARPNGDGAGCAFQRWRVVQGPVLLDQATGGECRG